MLLCPCGSQNTYSLCCGLYLDNQELPQTPEQLMRSRYTAYSQGKIGYIKATMKDQALVGFHECDAAQWAKSVSWKGLTVIKAETPAADRGFVEFRACFSEQNQLKTIHELSEFHKENGRWYYVCGIPRSRADKSPRPVVARNAPCPCGSGKKFKNCHDK